jgi:hypothetical protein
VPHAPAPKTAIVLIFLRYTTALTIRYTGSSSR